MKIKEYNQMMAYLTRPGQPTEKPKEEKPYYMTNLATGGLDNVNATPKRDILDYINKVQNTYDGVPLSEKNKKINAMAKGGVIKNKTPLATEKNKIVIAMSETPEEEYELQLGIELKEFEEWQKNNKGGTYEEFLESRKIKDEKSKVAFLTDEQKKDPKIIDLEPYLPSFEDIIKEYEEEQEQKKETLEQFINRRSKEMMLAESDSGGVSTLLRLKRRV
jgi:hypothetical protein